MITSEKLFKLLFGPSGERMRSFFGGAWGCSIVLFAILYRDRVELIGWIRSLWRPPVALASGFVLVNTLQLLYMHQCINAWIKGTSIVCPKSLFSLIFDTETLHNSQNKTKKLSRNCIQHFNLHYVNCTEEQLKNSLMSTSPALLFSVKTGRLNSDQFSVRKTWNDDLLSIFHYFLPQNLCWQKHLQKPLMFLLSPSAWPPLPSSPQSFLAAHATCAADSPAGGSSLGHWAPWWCLHQKRGRRVGESQSAPPGPLGSGLVLSAGGRSKPELQLPSAATRPCAWWQQAVGRPATAESNPTERLGPTAPQKSGLELWQHLEGNSLWESTNTRWVIKILQSVHY